MARPIKHWHKYRYDEVLNKWVRKKRYKHPVITVVKLDPDQALLATCKIEGVYFRNTHLTKCCYGTGGALDCRATPKGRTRGPGRFTQRSSPSAARS